MFLRYAAFHITAISTVQATGIIAETAIAINILLSIPLAIVYNAADEIFILPPMPAIKAIIGAAESISEAPENA